MSNIADSNTLTLKGGLNQVKPLCNPLQSMLGKLLMR
jgi:hypothetical protein